MLKTALVTILFVLVFTVGVVAGATYRSVEKRAEYDPPGDRVIVHYSEKNLAIPASVVATQESLDLESIFEIDTVFKMLQSTYALTESMSPEEVQALALDAAASKFGSIRNNIIAVCLRRLVEVDPESTVDFVQSNPLIPNQQFLNLVIANWLFLNPAAAVEYVVNLEPGSLRTQFAYRLIGEPYLEDYALSNQLDEILGPDARRT